MMPIESNRAPDRTRAVSRPALRHHLERARPFLPIRALIAAALLLSCGPAAVRAHGQYPLSTYVTSFAQDDPLPLVLTNFGILLPKQPGYWTWICEDVTGSSSYIDYKYKAFEVLPGRQMLLGTTTGLWRSEDGCSWAKTGAPLDTLYVTQVRRDTGDSGRLWASTSTGGSHNALWYSDDTGKTWTEGAFFGETSTIRGFLQGDGGLPWYVVGWRESKPYLWHSPDGTDWNEHPIVGADNVSVYALQIDANDDSVLYVTFHSVDDVLVRLTVGEDLEITPLFTLTGAPLMAFASGPAPGRLEVGSRLLGSFRSIDDGQTWSDADLSPEPDCLVTGADRWYECTNNWGDGAAVMTRSPGEEDFEPLMSFGQVHDVYVCPAGTQTADICEVLWESVKASSGLDTEPTPTPTPEPTATGDDEDGDGCGGCATAGRSRQDGRSQGAAALFAVGIAVLRHRRRPRFSCG